MVRVVLMLGLILLIGCDREKPAGELCWIEGNTLRGMTYGKVLHCEINDDGSVSIAITPHAAPAGGK